MSEDMTMDLKMTAPVLTLEPDLQSIRQELKQEMEPEMKKDPMLDDSMLSAEEKKMVDDFAKQINLHDTNMILKYGAGAQKKMVDFSQSTLENVKTQDLGEVGDMITNVLAELRTIDHEEEEKGFFGFFKKSANKRELIRAKYDAAENNVNKIVESLQAHQVQLMKDSALLDKMYQLNLTYFKELSMYILAGRKKLDEVREGELAELTLKAQQTGKAEDAQAARDLEAMCTRFEKKLYDLDLTRTVCMQTAPQIRMVQNNDILMVEKIQTTIVNTIPLWKNQMVLTLGMENSAKALKAQTEVTNMTNELLKKNAEMLHMSTVETARQSERGIVDIETLMQTNESLIQTLDEVRQIQQDGRRKRQEAELQLRQMEDDLKKKLLEL